MKIPTQRVTNMAAVEIPILRDVCFHFLPSVVFSV